mgnify:CR=1 FL=1
MDVSHAVSIIQKQWIKSISNNIYNICRKKEFYQQKIEEENERLYAGEYFTYETQLWCKSCILGICEKH